MSLITARSIIAKNNGVAADNTDQNPAPTLLTPAVEQFNGRASMVGLAALISVEVLKGSALF